MNCSLTKCDLIGNDYEKGNIFLKIVNRFFYVGGIFFRAGVGNGAWPLPDSYITITDFLQSDG
jgi:hypothetical protein